MNKIIVKLSLSLFAFGITNVLFAQNAESKVDKKVLNWYNGGGAGMQTEKAYKKLKKRTSTTVIVAVIDSGIDIEHKDLQGKIWTNTDEIPGNGIDDDNNGYIDDIHGWNYLGNSKGENANDMRLEMTRILSNLSKKYDGADPASLSIEEKAEYDLYVEVKAKVAEEIKNTEKSIKRYQDLLKTMATIPATVKEQLGKENYTTKDLKKWKPVTEDMKRIQSLALMMNLGMLSEEDIKGAIEHFETSLKVHYNVDFNGREIVGDNPDDFKDVKYGNNDVEGPDALHGTHVGGIIGAVRGNKLGGDGVCENVLLMSLRAVPNGDEFDKDIALAIRYAVDNGAKVINMSFGKAYSPHQKEVYEAFKYADEHGVLLVHAAGNDNKNVDVEPNFPTSLYSFQTKKLDHFLTIGASTNDPEKHLPAEFSNYGERCVDIFAPGHEIYNSVPQSEYQTLQGTSMAAPMISGVAAMLKSYFPSLTMKEIKDIMLSSSKSYKGQLQYKPGTETEVDFATLCVTGGVVDVYAAILACMELEKSKAAK